MNYSNMIEEKNLKKGFIIATLASTIIGTFTASLALHDKIKERQNKQEKTDGKQNEELKALKEQVEKLADKGQAVTVENRLPAIRSRSSSRSRGSRRRYRRRDSDDDYEDSARVQHVVVGVIQDALRKNPNLTEADVQKLVAAAEEAARDGTVDTLREHYQRMVLPALKPEKPLLPEEQHKKLPIPLDLPKGQRPSLERPQDSIVAGVRQDQTRSYAPGSVAGSKHDSHLDNLPQLAFEHKPGLGRHLEERTVAGTIPLPPPPSQKAPTQRAKSTYGDPFEHFKQIPHEQPTEKQQRSVYTDPFATMPQLPHSQQNARPAEKDSKSTKAEPPKSRAPSQPVPASERRPSSTKTEVPRARSLPHQPDWQPPAQKTGETVADAKFAKASTHAAKSIAPAKSEAVKSRKDEGQPGLSVKSVAGTKSAAPAQSIHPARSEAPVSRPAPAKSEAPPKSTKTETPKSRAGISRAPPTGFVAPISIPAPPIGPAAVESPRSTSHPHKVPAVKEVRDVKEVKSNVKALPAPPNDLFCRYACDLQNSHLPLHSNFKSNGSHRCPSCSTTIPVDTRDVWVLSTQFPKDSARPDSKPKTRDYRMDARFVVKCHTTDGKFACILCDKFRDRDCICKNVDALVKHLGTAHTPGEFDRDGDLVRMGEKRVVKGRSGGEMALA
ncbi:hypothetical protein Slin15195_G102090 [Septoria linicola]|uniref:Uncharacterized protein n=1 Tax=Septoria linicola TaxID=215465 RepID=A0A9Q9B2A8_9PEZI|nr:hypothetical protein Slin14017_G065090 [Septoria linicola]USW56890.1 hypothetical protein Slin15195_G102090 [Septoria linicola]